MDSVEGLGSGVVGNLSSQSERQMVQVNLQDDSENELGTQPFTSQTKASPGTTASDEVKAPAAPYMSGVVCQKKNEVPRSFDCMRTRTTVLPLIPAGHMTILT